MAASGYLSLDEFSKTLDSAMARFDKRGEELRSLISGKPVQLFGYGGKGRMLAEQIAKNGNTQVVVYDSNPETREIAASDGFATVDTRESLGLGGCGVILGACQAQMEQAAVVPSNHIYYQEAACLFDAPHLANKARDFPKWISGHKEPLYGVYRSVAAPSANTFLGILRFRLSLDPRDIASDRRPNSDMWFDVLEKYSRRKYATFLDVGAYDGDTLRQAQRRLSVTRGIAVEANTALFDSIRQAGRTYAAGIDIVPRAAWSHSCRLHCTEVRGGMITVSEAPDGELEGAPIDDGVSEKVDLVKMDIEGAEISALNGALRILETGPDLAIAAYHRPDDLVSIPACLGGAGYRAAEFDLHVAHYSDCLDDTVLYYVKR